VGKILKIFFEIINFFSYIKITFYEENLYR
jgi:hypothetical protein